MYLQSFGLAANQWSQNQAALSLAFRIKVWPRSDRTLVGFGSTVIQYYIRLFVMLYACVYLSVLSGFFLISCVVLFVYRWSDDVVHETGSTAVCQAGSVRSLSIGARSAEQNNRCSGRPKTETERIRRRLAISKHYPLYIFYTIQWVTME